MDTGSIDEAPQIAALRERKSQTTTGLVKEAIEKMIIDGGLRAGEHLREAALSDHLGVSRGPIREACRALVERGLLYSEANRGFFVRQVTVSEVIGIYEVRTSLARLAGRTLAGFSTPGQLAQLRTLVQSMDIANESDDFEEFYRLNLEFHNLTFEFTENAKLIEINKLLMRDLHLFRRQGLISGKNTRRSNMEHHTIMEALEAHDVKKAGDAMEKHINQGKERFLAAAGKQLE